MRNPWRTAFLALAAVLIVLLLALFTLWMSVTRSPRTLENTGASLTAKVVPIEATVPLQTINDYVALQLAAKQTPVQQAKIAFENQRVRVDTALLFFGRVMDTSVWMRPEVMSNGDVRLTAEEAKIGDWPIPLKTLFAVLEGVPWPTWVQVHAEQHTIDCKLSDRTSENGTSYRVKKIDWARQAIQLEILLTAKPINPAH